MPTEWWASLATLAQPTLLQAVDHPLHLVAGVLVALCLRRGDALTQQRDRLGCLAQLHKRLRAHQECGDVRLRQRGQVAEALHGRGVVAGADVFHRQGVAQLRVVGRLGEHFLQHPAAIRGAHRNTSDSAGCCTSILPRFTGRQGCANRRDPLPWTQNRQAGQSTASSEVGPSAENHPSNAVSRRRPDPRRTLGTPMRSHHFAVLRRTAAALFLGLGTFTPLIAGTPALSSNNPRVTPAVEAAKKRRGAVVNIHSERTVPTPADPFTGAAPSVNRVNGMGTGIVIDPRGYIVTNNHVVEDVQVIRIKTADGVNHAARVLARDAENDLAILKIDTNKPLSLIPLGTASDLMVLEPVIAIGNAFGYEHTHTMGTVSNVKRDVALNREVSYKGLIQTDASINPGNSGGPLLNMHGELIGVNVAIRAGAQNIGFAITVDTMIVVAADLISLQRRTGLIHGITCRNQVDTTNNPVHRTCFVERVDTGSAAERAGLRPGDQLLQISGIEIRTGLDLERGFLERTSGEKVAITIRRGGDEKSVDLTLPAGSRGLVASSASSTDV